MKFKLRKLNRDLVRNVKNIVINCLAGICSLEIDVFKTHNYIKEFKYSNKM